MIRNIQYGFAHDIPFETAGADVQGISYTRYAPLAATSAAKPDQAQSVPTATGFQRPGTDAVVILLLLLVVIYGLARWLRRRADTRSGSDFLYDSKLDPAKVRVLNISESRNKEIR